MAFMVHDKWENVLFVHYKIPTASRDFELLQKHCPFALDVVTTSAEGCKDKEASSYAWLGLVFLTERNVGAGSVLRGPSRFLHNLLNLPLLITHHGINVRTYVEGDGIFFYSLECDSFLATEGARQLGIPYRYSKITRTFVGGSTMKVQSARLGRFRLDMSEKHLTVVKESEEKEVADAEQKKEPPPGCELSPETSNHQANIVCAVAGAASERELGQTQIAPCTAAACVSATKPSATRRKFAFSPCSPREDTVSTTTPTFGFECEWAVVPESDENHIEAEDLLSTTPWRQDATTLVERYKVYSSGNPMKLTGCLAGRVTHEPWPLQKAELRKLVVHTPSDLTSGTAKGGVADAAAVESTGVETNEGTIQGMLQRLTASRPPDHVCFSPGVGPVSFAILRPYTPGTNADIEKWKAAETK